MKDLKIIGGTVLAFILFVSIFSSCVRERDYDTAAAEDNLFALFVYDDAINIANEAALLSSGDNMYSYKTQGYCGTVTNNPGSIVVDFDTLNCLCNDGRNRRGKVLISYTGNYGDSAETMTITFDNYYVNDNKIEGTEVVTGVANNAMGKRVFEVVVTGKIQVLDTLGAIHYNAELTRTWLEGYGTIVWGDDVFELTGHSFGVDNYNNNVAMRIVEPVLKPTSITCPYLNKGIVEVQPEGRTFRHIDLGDGSCDADATVTIDTKQHHITLK